MINCSVPNIDCKKVNDEIDKYNKKILNNNVDFIIFYKNVEYCGYSKNSIELLKKSGYPFKGYCVKDPFANVDRKDNLIKCLKDNSDLTGFDHSHNTLPIIFYKGKFVGGYTELVKFIKAL